MLGMIIGICLVSFAAAEDAYQITIQYDTGNLSLFQLRIINTTVSGIPSQGAYRAQIIDEQQNKLYERNFDISIEVFDVPFEERFLKRTQRTILLPVFESAKRINIYDSNKELRLSIDVSVYDSEFLKVISSLNKTAKVYDPFKEGEKESKRTNNALTIVLLIGGVLTLLAIIFLIFQAKQRKR